MRLVTQTLLVHQMYAFSYSILKQKILGLRGIIKISTAPQKTAPHEPRCLCPGTLTKKKHTVKYDVIEMRR